MASLVMSGLTPEVTNHNMEIARGNPLIISVQGWAQVHKSLRDITGKLPPDRAAKWQEVGYDLMGLLPMDSTPIDKTHTARYILRVMEEVLYESQE